MVQRFFVVGVIMLMPLAASAQAGGCSVTALFSVAPGNPVQLSFAQSTQAQLSKPVVSVAGSEITVVQVASDANQYPSPICNSQVISLGSLPPGSYDVTWKYQTGLSAFFFENFHFAFSLADAPPCIGGLTVQPDPPVSDHPVSIAYSAAGLGFVQPPSVAVLGRQISIVQPAAYSDRFIGDGGVVCARGEVGVGSLEPGLYNVMVVFGFGFAPSLSGSFVVRPATVVGCGIVPYAPATGPASGTPSVFVKTNIGHVLVHFENQAFSEYVGGGSFQAPLVGTPVVSVDGYRIHVTQLYVPFTPGPVGDAGPGFYSRFCQGEDVDLGPLRTGSYAVVWTYLTPKGPVSVNATFDNGPSRNRAVRGH